MGMKAIIYTGIQQTTNIRPTTAHLLVYHCFAPDGVVPIPSTGMQMEEHYSLSLSFQKTALTGR
jgi:hypothetical protein